jgi:negative regulator of sigma E activity
MSHGGSQSPAGSEPGGSQASQLSAMFDDALPPAECEWLALRLASDPVLQRQWARYALIGAALRGDPLCGVRGGGSAAVLDGGGFAARVQAALAAEPRLEVHAPKVAPAHVAAGSGAAAADVPRRWWKPVAATGIAASVAALSLVWLQRNLAEAPPVAGAATGAAPVDVIAPELASVAAPAGSAEVVLAPARSGEPESYVVPALPPSSARPVASAQLANFVVAHSEFSGSLARRSVLSALVSGEGAADTAAPVDVPSASSREAGR